MIKKPSHSDITRREFIGNHGLLVTIVAFMCGIKLDAAIVPTNNVGFKLDRLRWDDDRGKMERSMSEQWAYENDETKGNGTLQTLMWQAAREEPDLDPALTERERRIVAMVIQWLATGCGCSFLYEASRRMGPNHLCYPFHNAQRYADDHKSWQGHDYSI